MEQVGEMNAEHIIGWEEDEGTKDEWIILFQEELWSEEGSMLL